MPETTEKYLRVPQHPGKEYAETRHSTLSGNDGIDCLYGKAPGGSWEIRTLLFRRDWGWTWDKVRSWIQSHKQFSIPEALQEADPESFADMLGVEVFRPGTWKGIPYQNEDMDRIAENSNAMIPYFQAKLKLSHDEEQPAFIRNAALGIAANYYTKVKDGLKRVYADFHNVPTVLANAIEKFYPGRSVEKYRYFPHPDTKEPIPDVIKSVAFLGHMPPEVKGMFNDFSVLYDEAEQDRSDLIDCYEWRADDGPTDDVLTQDLILTPTESPEGEAPPVEDSEEESMPEEKEILTQEQTTEETPSDQPVSVEEEGKSDAQPIQQTVTVNVPEPPQPQGFSEEDLENAREQAKQEAAQALAEEYAEKEAKYQEELDKVHADNAALKAEKFEQEIDHYLEDLHLPESVRKLGVKAFLMRLDREQAQQFAEDGPEHSLFEHAKALLTEAQKYWEITAETLSSEQAPEQPDRRRNQEQQRIELFKELREEHPKLPDTEIMKLAADRNPELFKEVQEEVA